MVLQEFNNDDKLPTEVLLAGAAAIMIVLLLFWTCLNRMRRRQQNIEHMRRSLREMVCAPLEIHELPDVQRLICTIPVGTEYSTDIAASSDCKWIGTQLPATTMCEWRHCWLVNGLRHDYELQFRGSIHVRS